MKYFTKALIILFVLSFFVYQDPVNSATVDTASLSPARAFINTGIQQQISFSATNDKSFALKTYHAEFSYTAGLTISNFSITPTATTAKVDTRKHLIIFEWSNVASGMTLTANFNISATTPGSYIIAPSTIYYTDYSRNTYTGTCNSSEIIIRDLYGVPSPPKNVRSISGEGFITVYWDKPSDTDIRGYKVYRRTSSSDFSIVGSNVSDSPFSDTTIENGKTYYYTVMSVDQSGNGSDFSEETGETYIALSPVKLTSSKPSVGTVGDVNGDGKPDIILGGIPYLYGKSNDQRQGEKVEIYLSGNTTGIPDVTLYGDIDYQGYTGGFGNSIAAADLNHDGYDDIIVGAPLFDINYTSGSVQGLAYDAGRAYVFAGGPQISATPAFIMNGRHSYGCDETGCGYYIWVAEHLGYSMAAAGSECRTEGEPGAVKFLFSSGAQIYRT